MVERNMCNAVCEAAKPPSTVSISRPCGVVLSAHVSLSERKPAFATAFTFYQFTVCCCCNRAATGRASYARP